MIKDSLLKNITHEFNICQHLYTKLDPALADWRPRENMRSTVELLQYLTHIGGTMTRHFADPLEDREAARDRYRQSAQNAKLMTFDEFPETIEQQKKAVAEIFASFTDADLSHTTYHPFSADGMTLFDGLLIVLKYLCAYRHQLFLYAKMCGAEINTRNNWYGMDPQPVKQAAVA